MSELIEREAAIAAAEFIRIGAEAACYAYRETHNSGCAEARYWVGKEHGCNDIKARLAALPAAPVDALVKAARELRVERVGSVLVVIENDYNALRAALANLDAGGGQTALRACGQCADCVDDPCESPFKDAPICVRDDKPRKLTDACRYGERAGDAA